MPVIQRIVKAKTSRGKRYLLSREPQIVENTKTAILIKGHATSDIGRKFLLNLYAFKKSNCRKLERNNFFLPFEDITPIERLCYKFDCSLFASINHSKKRPHNFIFGRMYDSQLLDMVEMGIESYKDVSEFAGPKVAVDNKPCLVFFGSAFEDDLQYKRLKGLLIDFFRGVEAEAVNLKGFDHAILFLLADGKLNIKNYRILLKKSGTRKPRVELEEIGPAVTLSIRRWRIAGEDLYETACKRPAKVMQTPRRKKNLSQDLFGTKFGRVHMKKQDFGELQLRKMKGLPRQKRSNPSANFTRVGDNGKSSEEVSS